MGLIKKEIKFIPLVDQTFIVMLTASIQDFGFFDTALSVYGYYGNNFYDSEGLGIDNLL